ncbi:flagellar protein FlgN [Fictibacillus aquaticus]|uniref:Flagellar protein FlgN n=1 Tax=Fictibacillus aquaticus TaxID=2021314 RepID=A0A235FFN2_9BACL|nr:flagellar protein FlgN [Fictibacillus aquaticus]OYD59747.1 hypothetical protein CGZ90_07660 [Fictibacillus aquaticus]
MEAAKMIALLDKLNSVHQELISLGQRKTEAVKKGEMMILNALLKEEDIHTKKLQQIDAERTMHFGSRTLSDIMASCASADQERLSELQQEIQLNYETLKQVNELNQQLLHQSLQVVNLTLDMMMPEAEPVNYTKPQMKGYGTAGTSLFDSKA